ncbi:MAG: hypothetical protein J6A60_02755 [Clostridia bacterium]|nr:hypothetical protein [Clostridia bacterium]
MSKKILAFLVSAVMLFTAVCCVPASAADEFENTLNRALDELVDLLVNGISMLIAEPDWVDKEDYVTENFYAGNSADEFLDVPAEDAAWLIGYANASIQTGKELTEEHYVGGSLSVTKKLATEIRDDQKVRTIAVSDGRGITIFSVVDSYGMSLTDVRGIRAQFQKYADENDLDITAVNVSALHQHSCVDTFGLNGNLVEALFLSSIRNILGIELPSGQNKDFMENLYNVTVDTMIEAVENMEEGNLYYGNVDISEYIRDKRDPQVIDPNMNRLRFAPADGGAETWIMNAPIHCVGNGAGGTLITGDYPYFMEQYINETEGANVFYILGAELAISSQGDPITPDMYDQELVEKYDEGYAHIKAFGEALAKKTCSIQEKDERIVAPIFNIAFKEAFVEVENSILQLAAKGGLLTNQVVKTGFNKCEVVTEVGYCEFGTDISVAIIPGELAPEIAFGGAETAAESWDGLEWNYTSFADAAGESRKLIVFGITNDQIGYLLPYNEWHSYFTENEEIVSAGRSAGITITDAYLTLFEEVR